MEQQTIKEALEDLEAEIAHLRRTREENTYSLEWRLKERDRLLRYASQAKTNKPPAKKE